MSAHKPRGYSVSDFLSWSEREELVLQPKFQRRDVWSNKAKSHLVDTILRGLPIPIIFIRQGVNPHQRKTVREVVDGQQRLRSVLSYLSDEFVVLGSQNQLYGEKRFSQLPQEVQKQFLAYEFSVVLLEEVSDADVLDIFARLNTYAQKLTPQELLNAAYFGEFKQTVYRLGYEHLEFWRQNRILQDRQIVRMAEADLTTELMVAMLFGIQRRRERMQDAYEDFDDAFPDKERITREFKAVIDTIGTCTRDFLRNSIFRGRVLFSSLFCAFYHVMFGLPKPEQLGSGGESRQILGSARARVRNALVHFDRSYRSATPPVRMDRFKEASRGSTGDRERRVLRVRSLVTCIRSAIDGRS